MSADFDRWLENEPMEPEFFCSVHLDSYIGPCPQCRDDEADRQHDEVFETL